jgi:hypothetical protein
MGYISSASFISSFSSIANNFQTLNLSVSSITASNIYSLQGYFSSLTVSSLTFGSGDGFLDFGDIRTTSISTLSIYTSTINGEQPFSITVLQSTINGLGLLGYLSSAINISSIISTPQLTSSLQGLGSMGYLSSGTLNVISTPQLTSSLQGLGSMGYISTQQLTSTATGVFNYISTLISSAIQTVPTYYSGETVFLNLGISSGISSYHSMQVIENDTTSRSTITTLPRQTATPNLATPIEQFITDFSIPSFIPQGFWDVNLFAQTNSAQTSIFSRLYLRSANVEYLITESIPSVLTFVNLIAQYTISMAIPYVSTTSGDKIVLKLFGLNKQNGQDHVVTTFYQGQTYSHVHTTLTAITQDSVLTSTVAGLGTYGFISSSQLFSTVTGLGTFGYISSSDNLFSSIKGLGSMGYISAGTLEVISTPQLTSSLRGLGSMGYLSSISLSSIISTPQLTSSLVGLGSMGYLSSLS